MLALKGYSNGEYIVTLNNEKIPKNRKVIITILEDEENEELVNKNESLRIFKNLCYQLKNDTEELTDEFDNILSSRLDIKREIDLT